MASTRRRIIADYKTELVQQPTPTGLLLTNIPEENDIIVTPQGPFWVVSCGDGQVLGLPLQTMPYEVLSAQEHLDTGAESKGPPRIAAPPTEEES